MLSFWPGVQPQFAPPFVVDQVPSARLNKFAENAAELIITKTTVKTNFRVFSKSAIIILIYLFARSIFKLNTSSKKRCNQRFKLFQGAFVKMGLFKSLLWTVNYYFRNFGNQYFIEIHHSF